MSCDKRAILVNARDKEGKFLSSLQAADFRAKLNKKIVPIVSTFDGPGAHRVAILLDRSGSMHGEVKASVLRFISGTLIRSLPGNTQFAVVVFGYKVIETTDFGRSREEIKSAIDRSTNSSAVGRTALRDALLRAGEMLGAGQIGDSVIVALIPVRYSSCSF